jgi:hypothetical protein
MKTLPLVGVCVTVTMVLSAYAKVHEPVADALLSVHDRPDGELVSVPPPCDPNAADSVSVGGAVNCAVTLFVVPGVMVIVQVDALQAPEYPEKDDSPDGVAVSETTVFGGKVVLHVPPVSPLVTVQLMPDGTLVTRPLPDPPPLTTTACVWKIASAVRPSVIASWHGSDVQSPAHAAKTAFPLVVCWSVTTLLAVKNAVQVPLVVVPLSTQLMPAGALVTTPPPADPGPAVTVRRWGAALKAALTADVTLDPIEIAQDPPVQAPVKPSKLPLLVLPPISVTVLPASKVPLQMPLTTPAVMVHEMPDGELVTLPLPVPVPVTVTMPGGGMR